MTDKYPLQWPVARPRTKSRRAGNFSHGGRDITIAQAMDRVFAEMKRIGVTSFIMSSNLVRNRDGSIRSGQAQPADPGVAAYFTLNGKPICMPCDTFTKAEQNIAGIAKHIEATRAIERYGVASLSEMFTGFEALPAPSAARAWWEVLGVSQHATPEEINAAWRQKAKDAHSDLGGTDVAMSEINVARDTGLRARAA